jgi:hypothetical protein
MVRVLEQGAGARSSTVLRCFLTSSDEENEVFACLVPLSPFNKSCCDDSCDGSDVILPLPLTSLVNFPIDQAALPNAVSSEKSTFERRTSARQAAAAAQGQKIAEVYSPPSRSSQKRPRPRKIIHNPSPRVETDYPSSGMMPVSVDTSTAACYQDFVDIFCKEMWIRPNNVAIKDALRVAFKNRQSRYGKSIIPDNSLADLLERAEALPEKWDDSIDKSFVDNINRTGWYLIENLACEHEVLIIALMSISVYNWSTIKNRHKWQSFREQNQNRCAANPKPLT